MLADVLLAALLGAALLVAAGLKLMDRTSTAVAAASLGLGGRGARHAWLPLAALEAVLAGGLLAGSALAAPAAALLLTTFAAAQATAILAGRGGAPCGCFGDGGRISWPGVARAAAMAAAAWWLAATATTASVAAPGLRAAAAVAAVLLAAAIAVRLRIRSVPDGALDIAGEGPAVGSRLELPGDSALAFFSAPGCRLCRGLRPLAERLGAAVYDEAEHRAAWGAANVPGAPYAIALAADGTVLAKGTVNTGRQLRSLLAAAGERPATRLDFDASSRRGFLASAGAAVAAAGGGRAIGRLVAPAEARAHHFCGHIFTTDGCPHPTGLPRIDVKGYPLRGSDGRPVDDLGRLVDAAGAPIDDAGAPLLDPDGRPQPPTTRTPICKAAGRRFDIRVRTDGSWHRCCDGRVRKLIDCCSTSKRRINGDRPLKGYCYEDRKVFCVMYLQTKVPC